MSVPIL
jgi:26S proteasome regulatory subunit T6